MSKHYIAKKKKITYNADELTRRMLDATPLCCNLWDENYNNIDCNEEAVKLFELTNKQEYLERFFELSPEYQPDGRLSSISALEKIKIAFEQGRIVFEWMHQKLNGEPMPSEITLVRVKYGDQYIVSGYTHDLREIKKSLSKAMEADERTKIMLDATPLCANFWNENFENIDCNLAAIKLFDLKSKQDYLDNFFKLSPEYQPDGMLSKDKALAKISQAFSSGQVVFEWMHQKLNGELIPSEITLVRVKYGDHYIVVGYTHDLRELKNTIARLDQLEVLAYTDSLTGTYNRRYFMSAVNEAFFRCALTEQAVSLIILDLDDFKNVNDTYGHAAGDEVLKSVSDAIQNTLRENDVLARYGGEEFSILLKGSDLANAQKTAERVRAQVANLRFENIDPKLQVTTSIGLATRATANMDGETVLKQADEALYEAKSSGRNQVRVYVSQPSN